MVTYLRIISNLPCNIIRISCPSDLFTCVAPFTAAILISLFALSLLHDVTQC